MVYESGIDSLQRVRRFQRKQAGRRKTATAHGIKERERTSSVALQKNTDDAEQRV